MTQDELRRKCEDEAREILKCKVCEGHGWTVGSALGQNGEPAQTRVQCDKCYQGQIASYGDDLIKAITEALAQASREGYERGVTDGIERAFGAYREGFDDAIQKTSPERERLFQEGYQKGLADGVASAFKAYSNGTIDQLKKLSKPKE